MADGTVSRREQAYRQGRALDVARERRRLEPFVDPFLLPAGANPERDRQVAVSELGTPVYETLLGARYTIEQATMYPQPRGEARELSLDNLLAFAKELGLGAVQGVVQGVTAPGRALAGESVTLGDVWATAGLAGSGAIPRAASLPDPDVASMFGGKGTKNPTAQRSLKRAEELRDQGKDFEDIWRITSEEFPEAPASILPDGTPFYEFSDAEALTRDLTKMRAQDFADAASQPGIGLEERTMLIAEANRLLDEAPLAITDTYRPLQELLVHPRLYADYPELATAVRARESSALLKGNTLGEYFPDTGEIKLRPGRPAEDVMGTFLHEAQHGIAGRATKDVPQGTNQTVVAKIYERATGTDAVYGVKQAESGLANFIQFSSDVPLVSELTKTLSNTIQKDYKAMYDTASANRLIKNQPTEPGQGVYSGNYGMYRRDPGEALARLTAYRREYGMGQRREISPATDLARREGVSWGRLVKLQTAADIRKMFPTMQEPSAKGVGAASYAEAVNMFTNNALPTLIDDAKLALRSVPDADRPKAIARAQRDINEAFKKWLSKYEVPPASPPAPTP